jgi:NDP-sugar pyrophosphorylase family protein
MFPVVILAGGLATRMRPVTEKIPKAMIDVNGKPFVHYQLNLLGAKGISHIILCAGYLGEQIEQYVGNGDAFNLRVDYSYDGDILRGTGGAIKHIGNNLPDDFFILYGESYLDTDYREIENKYRASGKKSLMTVFRNEDKRDTSNVIFQHGELIKYSKKNKVKEMNYIDYGLGVLNKPVFAVFPKDTPFDLADIYEQLSDEKQLLGYEVFERFYEIGSPEGLAELRGKL